MLLWLAGLAGLVLLCMALGSYSPADPGFSISMRVENVANLLGRSGAWLADALVYAFGLSAWWLAALLAGVLLRSAFGKRKADTQGALIPALIADAAGLVCLLLGSVCLERFLDLHFYGLLPAGPGGVLGHYFCRLPVQLLGVYPALALFFFMTVLGASVFFHFSWIDLCERIGRGADFMLHWGSDRREAAEEEAEDRRIGDRVRQEKTLNEPETPHEIRIEPVLSADKPASADETDVPAETERREDGSYEESSEKTAAEENPVPAVPAPVPASQGREPGYPLSLLDPPSPDSTPVDEDALGITCRLIESKLKSFGIDAQVLSARPGPVITQYEIQPGPGVKGARIADVCDDLGRELGASSMRLVMNLPGTTSMGLEIPNPVRQIVRISEILGSEEFARSKSKLSLALGMDIAGNPYIVDLAKMPHLLVAGTTGSGKSVGINAMILSILQKSTADEVRLVMIDPKMVEFSPYEGIPNLLCQVVTDMSKAVNALQWLTREMNRRYAVMRRVGAKRFDAYNDKVAAAEAAGSPILDPFCTDPENPVYLSRWPYIVVIVDELADLILAGSRREVENLITSLAQKARAAGIHLILATQRPSTDIVTPLIKANVPAHISFQVVNRFDSQVIMGSSGAENLMGNGDMLFWTPGMGSMVRIQGCYVSDAEVEKVVEELKKHGEPDYQEEVMEKAEPETQKGGGSGESDALYDKAVDIVLSTKKASISSLQRHLSIGYNRAANLIEAMEQAGIVSEPDASGRRSILVPTDRS